MMLKFTVLVGVLILGEISAAKWPANWKKCNKANADFNDCLKDSIQKAVSELTKALPEASLPSFEPLEIPTLTIGAGTGAVNFDQKFTNIKLHGYSKVQVSEAKFDLAGKKILLVGHFDHFDVEANYDINGKILMLPITGKGNCKITISDVIGRMEFDVEEVDKKGKKHLKVVKQKTTIEPKGMHFEADNLFNGDKTLADNILKVVNDGWKDIWMDIKGGYESALGKINADLTNRVFDKYGIAEMFEG